MSTTLQENVSYRMRQRDLVMELEVSFRSEVRTAKHYSF